MKSILIIDRQPIIRLGFRLLIEANYGEFSLYEAVNALNLPKQKENSKISIIILGIDTAFDEDYLKLVDQLKNKFPQSCLIVYSDNLTRRKFKPVRARGIDAHISKQADEKEHISCLQKVMKKVRTTR